MIKTINISKTVKGRDIISSLSFVLPDTGLVFIKGDNGSGKTTLLMILALLDKPTSGSIFYDDCLVSSFSSEGVRKRKKDVLYLSPTNNFDRVLSIEENMRLFDVIGPSSCPFADRFPTSLSGGETQLCTAYLILHTKRKYVFMDEGIFYLDEEKLSYVLSMLEEARKTHLIVFASPRSIPLTADQTILLRKNND